MRQIEIGSTDRSVNIRIIDATTGVPETGVVFNTTGLDLWYRRELAASTDIAEVTLAALTTAHTDGGFLHINDGWYRVDWPDAAFASGVTGVQFGGTVTGMVVLAPYVELTVDLAKYDGPEGAGVYIDSGASNTNTVLGIDGTRDTPVSTLTAARTIADQLGEETPYYIKGNSDLTLSATHVDWTFIGMGSVADNVLNLGSQDVSRSLFRNLTVEGTQGGSSRITARDCALQDPGAGDTTLHIFAERCGFVDRIQVDTSNDNVFDQCYSLVAGTGTPVIEATGAAGTIAMRHYSGGIEFENLSASHNVSCDLVGQVVVNANCSANVTMVLRGEGDLTDNTSGLNNLSVNGFINRSAIADANWDELIAGHLAAGTTGNALNAAGAAGDPWTTLLPGAYGAGTAGFLVGTYVDAAISVVPTTAEFNARTLLSADYFDPTSDAVANVTLVATTTTNTDMRGTDSAATAAALAAVDGNVDLILVDTGTTLPATLGVIDSNVDAILVDTGTTLPASIDALPTAAENATAYLAAGDIDGFTVEETMKLGLAVDTGILAGAATPTVTIQAADNSKVRVTATTDANGNRTAVTRDATG